MPPAQATAPASAAAGDWATAEAADQAAVGHLGWQETDDPDGAELVGALSEEPVPWVLQQVCQGLLGMQIRPVADSAIADAVAAVLAAAAAGNAAVAGVAASAGRCH